MNSVLDTFRQMASDWSVRLAHMPSPHELCEQLFNLPDNAYPMN